MTSSVLNVAPSKRPSTVARSLPPWRPCAGKRSSRHAPGHGNRRSAREPTKCASVEACFGCSWPVWASARRDPLGRSAARSRHEAAHSSTSRAIHLWSLHQVAIRPGMLMRLHARFDECGATNKRIGRPRSAQSGSLAPPTKPRLQRHLAIEFSQFNASSTGLIIAQGSLLGGRALSLDKDKSVFHYDLPPPRARRGRWQGCAYAFRKRRAWMWARTPVLR